MHTDHMLVGIKSYKVRVVQTKPSDSSRGCDTTESAQYASLGRTIECWGKSIEMPDLKLVSEGVQVPGSVLCDDVAL